MNKLVSLPVAAAIPTSVVLPDSTVVGPADQMLVEAKDGMIATDAAIDQLYKQHGDAYEDRREFGVLEATRDRHINALVCLEATSPVGADAKAKALLERRLIEDWENFQRIAIGLARDIAGPFPVVHKEEKVAWITAQDDSKLLALADEFVAAEQRYTDALVSRDDLVENHHPRMPEALRIQPRDLELGGKLYDQTDEYWRRPCDIGQWRDPDDCTYERKVDGDCLTIITQTIPATEEKRLRAAEIVAAFDGWWALRLNPRGSKKAERLVEKARRECDRLEAKVCDTRAYTLEGMFAKIRCAEADERDEITGFSGGAPETLAISIFQDIKRLAARPTT
jgi:hypothetical protein